MENLEELRNKVIKLKKQNERLRNKLKIDMFTGLYNKVYALKQLNRRENNPYTLIAVIDIDYFKKINDTFGHIIGDKVLKKVAKIIKSSIRKHDVAFRFGGEEFVIICDDCNLKEANIICERIRNKIEKVTFYIDKKVIKATVSIGAAYTLVQQADAALYEAKRTGRNKTVIRGGK